MSRKEAQLLDMLLACQKIQRSATELDGAAFLADELRQDGILRQLTVLGEAAKRVSSDYRAAHPDNTSRPRRWRHRPGRGTSSWELRQDDVNCSVPDYEFEAAREKLPGEAEALAIRQIAEIVGISEERAAKALSAIESGTTVARQRLLRGIAEAWLEDQRKAYRRGS
jgi:hypothetical protein